MNILVISNAFEYPSFNARLRHQCDYLVKQGHQLDVYTEPWDSLEFEHQYAIYEIGERNFNFIKWAFLSIHSVLTNYKERKFALHLLWYIRNKKYDLIFCSTQSCFPLCAAAMVAKVKHLPLHVDISDLMELNPNFQIESWWHPWRKLRQKLYIQRRNQALQQADSITTLFPQHVEFIKTINPHVSLLYNGFDPQQMYYKPVVTSLFKVNYVGYAYESQNMDLILHIIDKFRLELPKIQWTFYSNDLTYNHIKYSRPNICGMLPKEIVADTLRQSSLILLVNDSEDSGLQSEQFYQAIGVEKPILFVGANEGAIPDMIALTQAGIASKSVKESMDYIRQLYHQWEKDGCIHQEIIHKDLFDVNLQGQQLEHILSSLLSQ